MVQLTCISTRGGDSGKTSLADGRRLSKHSLRIEAIGAVDEVNSFIGIALSLIQDNRRASMQTMQQDILHKQNDLFDVGSDLCLPDQGQNALRINETQVKRLDHLVQHYNSHLNPLNSFVLPGGTPLACQLHVCRSTTRRAERTIVALHQDETLNEYLLSYINRLSDVLFVMARVANNDGKEDVLWIPGHTQTNDAQTIEIQKKI